MTVFSRDATSVRYFNKKGVRDFQDSDSTGTTSYSYTPEGWVAGRAFSVGGSTCALGYSYSALGKPTAVVYPDGNQAVYSYTHGVVSGLTLKVAPAPPR